tara:strand:+ start:371 stop:1126 length:756 start_codon:yes stop_codon:yes gene_type:complete
MDEDVVESTTVDTPDSSVEVQQEPVDDGYIVKVDGVEEQVSLDELRDGYQRQSDYTRKTQELASERRRLEQAEAIVSSLESDPAGTLTALGDAFGVNQAAHIPAPVQRAESFDDAWDQSEERQPDVTAERITHLEARLAAQDRLHRRQEVERQVGDLQTEYGNFDPSDLFQHALRHKIGNLEAALTHMRYGAVVDRAAKLEKEQERTEAKRDASVVDPSGSKQAGSTRSAAPEKVSSIREAFEKAKRELAS